MCDEEVYNNIFLNERNIEFFRFWKVVDVLMRSFIDKGCVWYKMCRFNFFL